MFETLERLILLQIGAAAATRERVQETVNRLVEQGRLEREEGRTVVAEVLTRAQERSGGTRSLIDASMQQGLRGAGLPNRAIYEDLLFRVEQLEHRVRLLEDQPVLPAEEPVLPEEELPANATDSSGKVYVASSRDDRIQKFAGTIAAPTVSQVSPENGATGVSTATPVTATFSVKMDSSTLTASTIKMSMGKKKVPVGISCDDPCQTVTLDPYPSDSSKLLAANQKFKVTITTGAKDLAGNGLAKNYTWTFTTGST